MKASQTETVIMLTCCALQSLSLIHIFVAVVCNLLVASEQLLSTLGEGAGQTAVRGLVCQQSLILLVVHSLGGQGEGRCV